MIRYLKIFSAGDCLTYLMNYSNCRTKDFVFIVRGEQNRTPIISYSDHAYRLPVNNCKKKIIKRNNDTVEVNMLNLIK